MTISDRVRIAQPDRTLPAYAWTYEDITADVDQHAVTIRAGTDAEATTTSPATTNLLLRNAASNNYRYTPNHPLSDIPWFGEGTAVEYAVQRPGDAYLITTGAVGSALKTPDHASLRITNDHFGAVQVIAPLEFRYPLNSVLMGRIDQPSNMSYMVGLDPTMFLWLMWTTGGSEATVHHAFSTAECPSPAAGSLTIGWGFNANNGAGGHEVTFYALRGTIPELRAAITAGDPTVQLGDVFVGSGTTSIFPGTSPLWLGDAFDFTSVSGVDVVPYAGRIEAAELRDADHTGTVLANPVTAGQTAGTGAFVDTAATPKTWTPGGGAHLTEHRVRFLGEVTRCGPRAPGHGVDGTQQVEITAQSVRARNRQGTNTVDSVLARVEKAQDPANLLAGWTMEDGRDATRFASATGGHTMGFGPPGVANLASGDTLDASRPLPHIDAGDSWGYRGLVHPAPGITNYRVTMFFDIPTLLTAGDQEILTLGSTGTVASWTFFLNDSSLIFQGFNSIRTLLVNPGGTVATEWGDGPTQLTLGVTQNGGNIDWAVAWLSASGNVYGSTGSVAGTIGYPTDVRGLFTIDGDGITLGHCFVTTNIDAAWLGWTSGARLAYTGEDEFRRVLRLITESGETIQIHVPNREEVANPLGPQLPQEIPNLIDDAVAAGLGILSDHPTDFGYHYRTRAALYNQQPRWTVDSGAVMPLNPNWESRGTVNDATVTRTDGGNAHAENTASKGAVGAKPTSPTLNVESDNQLPELASWLVHVGTWPGPRYEAFTVALTKPAAVVDDLIGQWLGTAIGDVVALDNPPAWVGQPEVRQLLRGYTETIEAGTPGKWLVTANVTDAGPYTVAVVGDSVLGRADTDGSELDAGVDDNDTAWDVLVTAGPEWIATGTHPSEFPFDLRCEYEIVEVTAIGAAAGGVQTFTVVRGQRGTTPVAHAAGAAVSLADPMRCAL